MTSANIDIVRDYFTRADNGGDVTPLFAEDCQIYYPKFGLGTGRSSILEFAAALLNEVKYVKHPLDRINFIEQEPYVVAEGLISGEMLAGEVFEAERTPTGRFCSVFEIRGGLIARMHIYVDPDYGSRNAAGFLWGKDRRW